MSDSDCLRPSRQTSSISTPTASLEFMVERFHPRLAVACSFQKEASVVLDLILKIAPDARVFTLDTHVLFPETYETWRKVEERYGITVEVHQGPSLGRQAATHGDRLWERDPDACCDLRKVQPLQRALADVDAWISGVRREQGAVARRAPPSSHGTPSTSAGRPTRWPTGPSRTSGATSSTTTSRTTSCTIAATPRSAARTARAPAPTGTAAGPGTGKVECGLHA